MRTVLVEDARHALVSKARGVSQARLDPGAAAWAWRPPQASAAYDLLEVDVRSALTPFGLGDGYGLNPYAGCSHACAYCYVPDTMRLERPRWGRYVIAKRNLPTVLGHELRRRPRAEVFLSTATDPYQPVEGRLRLTRACLQLLARADWPVSVLTRSPLVVRDPDLFARFSAFEVGLSVPTLDDAARRALEPHAPSVRARLQALRRLADAGLAPRVSFAPAYPPTGGFTPESIAATFANHGVASLTAGGWRYLESIRGPVAGRAAGTQLGARLGLVEDPAYYRPFFRRLAHACARAGIAFETAEVRRAGPGAPAAAPAPKNVLIGPPVAPRDEGLLGPA